APGAPLLRLPNAWDVAGARLFERAGARAIATSSAAVAWALGARDGEKLPLDMLVDTVARIARAVRVPVTVDLERGYGDPGAAVGRVVDAGAQGVNLEDAAGPPATFAAAIAAVKAAHPRTFVNARTCLVLHRKVPPERAVEEVLARARTYADAGADGFFVPGLVDLDAIAAVARGTALPLNVLPVLGPPGCSAPAAAGVRRVSTGPVLFEIAYAAAPSACASFLGGEDLGPAERLAYLDVNALFG